MEKIKSGAAASLAEAERRAAEKEKELRQQNEDLLNRSKANVTIACKKWFNKGSAGVLKMTWSAWHEVVEKKKKAEKHSEKMKHHMATAMGASAAFMKQAIFQQMKVDAELAKHLRASEQEYQKKVLAERAEKDKLL